MLNNIKINKSNYGNCDIYSYKDDAIGLNAVVAIDQNGSKPAIGGCRFIAYNHENEALEDAVKLAKSMSLKTAVSGMPFSGGKAVIIKNNNVLDRQKFFESFGLFIQSLNGKFITGCDSGVDQQDMRWAASKTNYITGLPNSSTEVDDLIYLTALGVLQGIITCVDKVFGRKNLEGLQVGIQGVGKVGRQLAQFLYERGVRLTVTDLDTESALYCRQHFHADIVDCDEFFNKSYDVISPCALGGILNKDSAHSLKVKIICGAANNQLSEPVICKILQDRDIVYIPDFVANVGGTVYAAGSYLGIDVKELKTHVMDTVEGYVLKILTAVTETGRLSIDVAQELAANSSSISKLRRVTI